jgi:dolichol-phosphate mannosyltransferase
MNFSRVFIILPAYNEEKALRRLLPELGTTLRPTGRDYRIYVIDDGSQDGTAALLQTLSQKEPIETLRHEKNQGYGAAVKTGMVWVATHAQPQDIVVSLDSDNTHPPTYIPLLLDKIEQGFDVVTASYAMPGGQAIGVPLLRRALSVAVNWLFALRFRIPGIRTYTNGFRAYRVQALQQLYQRYGNHLIEATGFPGGTELFLKVCQEGNRAGEVPFTLHYENRGTQSKIRLLPTIRGYLQLLARCVGKQKS